ncbi:hypothetical protein GCM10018793_24290 [Streptomyces sulfonofaciens]|uniref:Uncharacterized protein n=1 Tax=Streptomyces sulfonofaciens TaxID=68272 RepID=A0A919G376_9ACTN|nr:hypothetical protein GCM10018793_24290 [Streptomyces sulfonofaciens]
MGGWVGGGKPAGAESIGAWGSTGGVGVDGGRVGGAGPARGAGPGAAAQWPSLVGTPGPNGIPAK